MCRSRVRQTTLVDTLHLWLTVCKLSPFHCICPNMLPYSDALCQEAFLLFLFRTPSNQPSEAFVPPTHSQNVKLSSPQGDVLECLSESMIAAQVERTKGKLSQSSERRTDRLVLFIYYWFIPAAILSEVLEFQLFPTLFCKSYYPPLISCSVLYIVQSVSAHFSVIALHEEFFPPGRVKTQQRREFQPVVVR